jgi:hypothetical protein
MTKPLALSTILALIATLGMWSLSADEPATSPSEAVSSTPTVFWTVVGTWNVRNPDWIRLPNRTDTITIASDGTYQSGIGETGRWILTADQGTPVLVMRWTNFATESVAMVNSDYFRGQKRGNRFIEMRRAATPEQATSPSEQSDGQSDPNLNEPGE